MATVVSYFSLFSLSSSKAESSPYGSVLGVHLTINFHNLFMLDMTILNILINVNFTIVDGELINFNIICINHGCIQRFIVIKLR